MSIDSLSITPREKTQAIGAGSVLGLVGMSAYYLPITKNRFVRNSYDVVKQRAKSDIEQLDEIAIALNNKNLKSEQKIFLSQMRIGETLDEINGKVIELKKLFTDNDVVKTLKQGFLDNYQSFKTSEALLDPVSTKALQKIRWTNFGWGTFIGFVLGSVLSLRAADRKKFPPQV